MANFITGLQKLEDTKTRKMRTNTQLKVSEHDRPAEKFMVDPRLPRLFEYHFGGDGWVVIPKGRIVAPATNGGEKDNGMFLDMDMGANFTYPAITLANGGVDVLEFDKDGDEYTRSANIAIGVASHSIYEEFLDDFNRIQPTISNEEYIKLPYISNHETARSMDWGCVYDAEGAEPLKTGDYVMSDDKGYFIKADVIGLRKKIAAASADELPALMAELARLNEQIIGQVWAVEDRLETRGWEKWVGWADADNNADHKESGARAEDLIGKDGDFPGYPYDKTYKNWDTKTNKYFPTGVPGLTDGSNIEKEFKDEKIGVINPGVANARYDLFLANTPAVNGTIKITIGGEDFTPAFVDPASGRVVFNYDSSDKAEPLDVVATYKARGQYPGTPTNRDFKDSIGEVRILLQK